MKGRWHADPRATAWLVAGGLWAAALMIWAGGYLAHNSAGFTPDVLDGPRLGAQSAAGGMANPHTLGRRTYALCAGCHQPDGRGVPDLYPALAGSEILAGNPDTLVRVVLHGLQPDDWETMPAAPAMPGWSQLSNAPVAAVLTYARESWGNAAAEIPEDVVADIRRATAGRHSPLRRGEVERGAATRAYTE